MLRLTFLSFTTILLCCFVSNAQEICNNGIDDDGDGLIDCYDTDCCSSNSCDSFYYPACVTQGCPNSNTNMAIQRLWQQSGPQLNALATLMVANIDNDPQSEVIGVSNTSANALHIIDGLTGNIQSTINVGSTYGAGIAVGDIDNDGQPELLVPDNNRRIRAFEVNGTPIWTSSSIVTDRFSITCSIADFNQDGLPEVYAGRYILNGQTGQLIVNTPNSSSYGLINYPGSGNANGTGGGEYAFPVAADVLPDAFCADCTGLEYVAGNMVYAVNISTGTLTTVSTAPGISYDGSVAVADWDRDGQLDVCMTYLISSSTALLTVWNPRTNTIIGTSAPLNRLKASGRSAASPPAIADIDNDGELEGVFATQGVIGIVQNDFTISQTIPVNESYGQERPLLFDFNSNGQLEIAYKDDANVSIYDAITGTSLTSTICNTRSGIGQLTVADVNTDGSAELLCTCSTTNSVGSLSGYATALRGQSWGNTRAVWNQSQFFNVNINDDLSIPTIQQQHQLVEDSVQLNTFGAAYNIIPRGYADASLQILSTTPNGIDSLFVQLEICNQGVLPLPGTTPIHFFNGDRELDSVFNLLSTPYTLGTNLLPSSCITLSLSVLDDGQAIYAYINTDTFIKPNLLLVDFPDEGVTGIGECSFLNNVAVTNLVEICNNGIDDDNDGLIDCYDPGCCADANCDNNYYNPCPTNLIGCVADSIVGGFSMQQVWQGIELVNSLTNVVVGDLDGDAIPEIVATKLSSSSNGLVIFDSQTGAVKRFINVPTGGSTYNSGLVLADMDNDGQPEIIYPKGDGFVECYEYDGTRLWRSSTAVTTVYATLAVVADLNQDGLPEVVVGRGVINGQNGVVMGTLSGAFGNTIGQNSIGDVGSAIAADVLPDAFCTDCTGLEVVAGNTVYTVAINTTNNTANVTTNVILNTEPDGMTSIADWDGDGDLDGIITHTAGSGFARLYVWDLQTPTLMITTGNVSIGGGGTVGVGAATVADIDNDGQLEAAFVLNQRLVVVNNNGTIKWSIFNSDRSGLTGITLYDFDGNGQYELVYRDESNLQVFDASTGAVQQTLPCFSLTGSEYPIISDMDGDGETEVLCTCGANGLNGFVTAFESAGTPWVPSRPLWNQYQYFATNINDDLTVPRVQQLQHIVGDSIELNAIRKQYQATGQTPLPDAAIQILTSTTAPPDSVDIDIQICNLGDAPLSANTPITFYNANPTTNNLSIPVGTIQPIDQKIEAGNCITQTYRVLGTSSDIYAVVNCDNTIPPVLDLNVDFPMTTIAECNYMNNIANRTILLSNDLLTLSVKPYLGNQAVLTWSIANPSPQTNYYIERSPDGIRFERIGKVTGKQRFVDTNPIKGANYYRVQWVKKEASTIIYSPIRYLSFSNNSLVKLMPNPFKDYIKIETQFDIKSIKISNTLGQIIDTKQYTTTSNRIILDTSHFDEGVYWMRIDLLDGERHQYSIIKNN